MRVIEVDRRPTASSSTIPTCDNPVTRAGIETGSPWWEAERAHRSAIVAPYLFGKKTFRMPKTHQLLEAYFIFNVLRVSSDFTYNTYLSLHVRYVGNTNASLRSCGGVVVRLLSSYLEEPGSIPVGVAPGFSHVGIVLDDFAGQRVFSGISQRAATTCVYFAPLFDRWPSPGVILSEAVQPSDSTGQYPEPPPPPLFPTTSKISPAGMAIQQTESSADTGGVSVRYMGALMLSPPHVFVQQVAAAAAKCHGALMDMSAAIRLTGALSGAADDSRGRGCCGVGVLPGLASDGRQERLCMFRLIQHANLKSDQHRADFTIALVGAAVVLLASHHGETGSIPDRVASGSSHVRIVSDDAAGRQVFSGISRFSRPFILALLCTQIASPPSALKTSVLKAVQISSLTHSLSSRQIGIQACNGSSFSGEILRHWCGSLSGQPPYRRDVKCRSKLRVESALSVPVTRSQREYGDFPPPPIPEGSPREGLSGFITCWRGAESIDRPIGVMWGGGGWRHKRGMPLSPGDICRMKFLFDRHRPRYRTRRVSCLRGMKKVYFRTRLFAVELVEKAQMSLLVLSAVLVCFPSISSKPRPPFHPLTR
ncbi:hypothetical protein PR048_031248 [Dryococelus australis]|uniref:Uncharacterized protein n=1 Tax=Dryococelus australis TaxID=614101 RepID=A0ABQ9G7H4_9NEOP|nr:hypothetical protein PR048_031248 [Dryococelus australis]